MACKVTFVFVLVGLLVVSLAAPAEKGPKEDLVASEKEDLQTAASHYGGYGYGGFGYGGYGGYGFYPHYGYGYGFPGYGYGFYGYPYGGYYGHHGYWW